ncbi:MAG: hypothetical protein AB7L09_03265 [Nitrospira sp.]
MSDEDEFDEDEFLDQEQALINLMKIKCKVNHKGCDGPWCKARAAIAKSFGMESEIPSGD